MIVSVHLANVGARHAPGVLRTKLDEVAGLTYSQLAGMAPLGQFLPLPRPGKVALIAAWEDGSALDAFLAGHPLAEKLAGGSHHRLEAVRTIGSWSGMPWLPREEEPMPPDGQAAVLTLGRLRLRRTFAFARASRPAERLVVGHPAVEFATALARPPRFVATFSLWRNIEAMRAYATGRDDPGHRDAMRAHAANPFHHESAFVRFRRLS